MGNEASLEGGGGGLPEGLSPGGSIPTEADLSQLGEEERRRLEALLSRAKESPRTPGVDANHQPPQSARSSPGPSGLSKSRTVDAFKTGPPARHVPPGRSPSSVSLLESRSREEPRSAMFSSGFLSGANPLSAVSSAVSKFSLFGDDEEEEAKKQVQQQQGPSKAGQGPSKAPSQQQGPSGPKPSGQQQPVSPKVGQPQQTGPQQGVTKPGIQPQQGTSKGGPQQQQQQGPAKGATQQQQGPPKGATQQQQGPPKGATQQQQGPPKGATQQQQGPPKGATQQQQGPPKGATQQQQGPPKGATQQQQGPTKDLPQPQQKTLCPVCKSTQLNLHTNEPANYNTCTECKSVVCSLCGFSPPDSAVKEWLCLNCQMQRALGAADLPGPQMMKPPKQTSLPSSPQKKPGPSEPSKPVETKKPPPLVKQQSTAVEVMKSAIPPSTPPAAQKAQGKGMEPSKETQKGLEKPTPTETQKAGEMTKGAPKPVTKLAEKTPIAQQPMIDPKPTHEKQEPAKPPQLATKGPGPASSPAKSTLPPKVQPAPKQESGFFGLSFASFTEAPKPQPTSPQPPESSGKMFGFGGFTETPKPQATTPQATESVSGKMFGFGSSIFSSASSLIGSAVQDESTAATTKDAQQPSKTSSATEAKASPIQKPEQTLQPKPPLQASQEKKPAPMKTDKPSEGAPRVDCPLCKVELNIGSKDPPNYNTCTECKKTVCNLCGFNPMPHLTGNDWLCLNCQTQRALAGQLGGMDPMSPPKLSPAKAPGQQPAAPKTQPSQVMQTKAQAEPSPPKPTSEQQKVEPPKAPSPPSATAKPSKGLTKMSSFDQSLASKPEKAKGVDPAASGNEKTSTVDAINTSVTPPEAPKKASSSQNALISPAPAEQHVSQSLKDGHRAAGLPPKASEEKILPKTQEKKMVEVQPLQKHVEVDTEKEKHRKEEKSHSTGSSQRKSPQGLSDTGYSSEGISGSLGEIPSVIPEKELLKEPIQKDTIVKESSPTSPSDLAKLERSVLPILEAQASTEKKEPSSEDREKRRRKLLPISPESFSSEEDFEDTQESESPTTGPPTDTGPTKDHRKTIETKEATSARKHRKDSIEDSSGSEPSPNLQRRRKVSAASSSSEEYKLGSPGSGDEEEFIRRQIMEMSADEDASGSDEENYVHKRIKEQEQKKDLGEIKDQDKNALGKSKHLLKKSKLCQEEEMEQREEKELKPKEGQYPKIRETKSEEAEETSPTSVGGLRRFKTIELNNTTATPYQGSPLQQGTEEGDDIESLTDSPEDRSKGEGSSSLHASSFTPGTSPTSVSSLDEDSDSSPSHKRVSGEAKHKKSRHRQPGQILPTIEDSSEEEEMREEEDILKEKEKHGYVDQHQVKKSNKKSKKDKEELRAQRRREYPKTPPSNLSPIEDASPTEELRQAAEMEELHKSSCSEYSPSIESEPEGFQIKTEKKDVPKVYQLPTSVSLYSPTDEQQLVISKGTIEKSLKSADEAYEEMMQKAKVIHDQKKKVALPEKESLYGGMLIEDYIYESLVEDSYEETVNKTYILQKKESSEILVKEPLKKLRSPDEVYEEMMQKKKAMMLEEEQIQKSKPKITNKEIIHKDTAEAAVPPIYESRHETALNRDRVSLKKDGKPLLDAEATYEELMKRQRVVLTPGTSPTQPAPGVIVISSSEDTEVAQGREHGPVSSPDVYLSRALYPIPDLKITQCSSGEDEVEDEENLTQQQEVTPSDIPQAVKGAFKQESVTTTAPSSSESTSNVEAATFTTSNESQTHAVVEAQVIHPIQAEPSFAVAKCSALAQHLPPDDEQGVTTASTKILVTTPAPPLQTQVTSRVPAYDSSQPVSSLRQASFAVPSFQTSPLPPPFFVDVAQSYNTPTVATQSAPVTAASPQFIPSVVVDIPQSVHDTTFSVPSVPVAPHEEASSLLSQVGHLVAQPKEEHVVISLPSLENIPVLHEIQQDPRVMSDTYSMIRASQVSSAPSPTASFPEHPFVGFSALPTLPQYAPSASTVISTAATAAVWAAPPPTSAPPVPPKPVALYRGSSLERTDAHVFAPPPPPPPPPLPPPTMPKPTIYPKKRLPVGMPPVMSSTVTMAHTILTSADQCTTVRSSMAPSYKPHVPPPVPPKPSSIPVGLVFSHKPGESVKPPVAPKPVVSQPCLNNQIVSLTQPRYVVPPSTTTMILNLTAPSECKLSSTSPKSPLSPKFVNSLQETYVVITLPSEPGSPVEGISTQAPTTRCLASPTKQPFQTTSAVPVTLTHYTKSIESQQVHAPEKLVSHTSRISCTVDPPPTSVSFVAQVMTTEVQRTTVSVVQERLPTVTPTPTPQLASISITRPQDLAKTQPKIEENGKIHYSGDVVDLRTMKVCVQKSGNGMDLTAPDCKRQVNTSESNGRQSSAVQPAVINLSGDTAPLTNVAVVTSSITIVTCTATVSQNFTAADRPLDLAHSTTVPLQLTTSKSFEPVAQIIYRPIDSQSVTSSIAELPINLSLSAITSTGISKTPVTIAPALSNGTAGFHAHMETESLAAVDLSTSKPVQTMVAVNGSLSAVVTSVIEEDDGKPVDLTAGKRAVCCDVVYKLPFAGSCTTQQAVTPLPEDRFGYRDDHYQYDRPGNYGMRSFGGMKPSMSDTNLAEAGLFFYKSKHSYDYNVTTEGAVDLTSGKISTGEIMDYSNKGTNAYSGLTIPPYCQARITPPGTHFGVSSVLRSSNGIVYSSVAAPVPSTYAITTQPGSIFSTTYKDLSGMHLSDTMPSLSSLQSQPLPRSYSFLSTTVTEQDEPICLETGISKEGLTSTFSEVTSTVTDSYTDASLEAIAASLEALASPMIPGGENSTYQIERELLELEKIKQLRLAEELEWERQEIQRFREQEQIIVQKELEELQSMKQQILCQQEEERQAHLMMQQETYAQQQLQLEQIHQLQQQLQQQLEEQKLRQLYPYGYEPSESSSPPTSVEQGLLDLKGDHGQYWPVQDETATSSTVSSLDLQQNATWYTVPSEGVAQYIQNLPGSEISLKEAESQEQLQLTAKKIVDSGVQTDDEDDVDRAYTSRRKRNKKSVDSSVQTDDEDQDEWDIPTRNRRRSRSSKYAEGDKGKQGSKVSSIAIQTVAEISVQTDSSGTIKKPSIKAQMDTTVEIVKHISAPEKTYRGGSLSCQTGTDSSSKDKRRPTPLEIGYNSHLKADSSLQVAPSPPKSPKVLYSPISPLSPSKSLEFVSYDKSIRDVSPQKVESFKPPPASPRTLQRSLSDPKPQSPTGDERTGSSFQYSDGYSGKVSTTPSGTQKKVKRTLPNPPPEEETAGGQGGYSTGSARRRLCRNTTMARAKILQDIDRELDLVERESSKLRKKQAELDEEEKEIDAKLRYLEMGINRRKDALLKEREKRERAYLQGVAEERDYMSDSEVSNIRETRGNGHGLERPRTAPQSEFNQFIPPQTQTEAQYVQQTRPYAQYPYTAQTQAATQYPQQTLYQQQSLYHQQVSPYQTQSIYSSVPTLSYPQATQQQNYQHATQLLLMQQKARQTTLSDLEPKITTNYEVVRNQSLMMAPSSTDAAYTVSHLGSKYSTLDLRMGLDERSSMASSPMSSISADSFYADIEHHTPRNYVLIDDIGELTKGSAGLSSSFTIPDKDLTKADRLLRSSDVRRSAGVTDFLGVSSRLHPYGKTEEDTMEEPYELKLLKQQIKQEFRRGTDGLDHLTGLPHYYPTDSYRPFPKTEKYSIGRLTLEKQAAKQLPASVLYQKQAKQKKTLLDPKITKFSPIQESRDLDPDYSSYLTSGASSVGGLASRARLLQDDITFGLRKNITEQQKYLGSTLGANLAQSLNLGQTLNLEPTMRSLQDDATYPSGSRSRPSSRPSSVYGLDLSLKRDLSSSSLRLKTDSDLLDGSYPSSSVRPKPTSLPISQSRGRIPIVAQNSEEESPLSPVGQPMGMARASAGPLPPISADSRDQFGSSHSLPEVQQHMREESRTRGYDRDIAFIMDDLQGAMSDSEAYHLRREETDWFDKPREGRAENGHGQDRRQVTHRHGHQQGEVKPVQYCFPHIRLKLQRDSKDHSASGNGLGIRVVGGKEIPGSSGEMGAYIAKVLPGGAAEQTGKVVEGMQVLEWNGIPLICKTYEEVQGIVGQQCGEVEVCVRLDLNMLSDSDHPQRLELHDQTRAERQRSPGVDPKQLAAELQKVSQQQAPSAPTSTTEKPQHTLSGTTSAASSAVPSPGQPGSPAVSKKRHSSKTAEVLKTPSHPITGEMQLQINYDKQLGNLIVHVLQARSLAPRDNNGYSDPFVKVYLLPGRGAENKRRTKHMQKSLNPEWNQTVIYKNIHLEQLKKKTLEVTVWDYDRFSSNDFLGEVLIDLSNTAQLDNTPRWFPLKEQSESIDHSRTHSSQGSQQSPKTSVIKSRSHGIFPDPSKDMQVPTIEKSHSSPGSSKSSSSHGPSRSQSKSSVTQAHLEDAGAAIAAAEAAVQHLHLQPTRPGHRPPDVPVTTTSSGGSSFGGSGFNLDLEGGTNGVDSAIFQVPRMMYLVSMPSEKTQRSELPPEKTHNYTGAPANSTHTVPSGKTIPNGTDKARGPDSLGLGDAEGKTQVMGEIKIALKKEMKTEGEQLIVEILQCRNITYKFKSPDHLPDLYVKFYVVNVATQKRVIKKKTRVCRHDREPSFNETFRFNMNPAGHSIQLFLVSNGGKFMKKTLIGEAYIWLDKVDLRKRVVNWHKLLVSSAQTNP